MKKLFKETTKLCAKDLSELMSISLRLAQKYFSDIKKHFSIKIVLYSHFKIYFNI
jgi:cytoplasmic iron level regulating protein YaaA (DUF328/UPF0246 family)